ncbi:sugar phosphate nucleotidyltransferase [Microtetraspora fusca]|uniref:UTP--glucose-1-phosphate uridylyltransferase n=1 Tax=Microtetraspora fusca TaxID=1997 RepID=A0ABW6VE27_MICFU
MIPARPTCPAVVTAAGHGTRFRPFTDWVPKEMLPIGSRPALGHVIDECLAAGADLVYVVTRPGDQIIPAYVGGLHDQGLPVRAVPEDLSYGYGNAAPLLTLAQELSATDVFMVAFGDDILLGGQPGADLAAMRDLADQGADSVIAAQLIDRADVGSFGVVDLVEPGGDRISGIRQRPDPATVGEPLAVVSRLVLRPDVLPQLVPREEARGEVDLGLAVGDQAHTGDVRVRRLSADWVTVGEPRRYADALFRHWRDHAPSAHSLTVRS